MIKPPLGNLKVGDQVVVYRRTGIVPGEVTKIGRVWVTIAVDVSRREKRFSLATQVEEHSYGAGAAFRTADQHEHKQRLQAAWEVLWARGLHRFESVPLDESDLFAVAELLAARDAARGKAR